VTVRKQRKAPQSAALFITPEYSDEYWLPWCIVRLSDWENREFLNIRVIPVLFIKEKRKSSVARVWLQRQ
jgi:hypothetical protein